MSAIDFGNSLLIGIVQATGFGVCLLFGIVQTIDIDYYLLIGSIDWRLSRQCDFGDHLLIGIVYISNRFRVLSMNCIYLSTKLI